MESAADAEPTLIIRLTVGMDIAWDMLPYPNARRSVVTRHGFLDARSKLGEQAQRDGGMLLNDLSIQGQSVPDLLVMPSLAPSRLRVDGFLGLDFFGKFDVVEWHPKTRLMRLTIA
jgi:hypothetical protein